MRIVDLMKNFARRFMSYQQRKRLLSSENIIINPTAKVGLNCISNPKKCFLKIGEKSIIEGRVYFEREGASVVIGDRTFVGGSSILCAENITIGDDVLIAFGVVIVDHDSHSIYFEQRANDVKLWYDKKKDWTGVTIRSVKICNKAWIGMHSIILKGTIIGEGAVVGAGSVVTKDVPPHTVVAGNPARIIRNIKRDKESEL